MDNFSYWERTAFTGRADVVIIGSGLVGLSAALSIKQQHPHLDVLVLERGFLPSGASTKNAGFACFGTATELLENIQRSSPEEALKLVDYKWRGLQRLRQNLGDDHIRYHQHGGYELFLDQETQQAEEALGQLAYLNHLLKPLFKADVYQAADHKIAGFGFKGIRQMIYNPFEGQIHTGHMMRTMLHKVYQTGTIVLNNCRVTDIQNQEQNITIQTDQGTFRAGKVILATNAFAKDLYPELNVIPGRGQVLVTKPIAGLKLKGTYHFNQGYYYFRNIDDRILFGGGRNINFAAEETTDFGYTEAVQQQLLAYLREVIAPDHAIEPDTWWSGIMGFGEDLSPIIKEVRPNVFCAVRCNGMGVAMGSLVGEQVAKLATQTL